MCLKLMIKIITEIIDSKNSTHDQKSDPRKHWRVARSLYLISCIAKMFKI